jgi:hypothetical protein
VLPATASAARSPQQYLSVDAAHRVAHLKLLASVGTANNGFNFDGWGRGELLVRVPRGWRVVVDCVNHSGGRHSCAVVAGALATRPAFPGASTPSPIDGLRPGQSATFMFTASRTGTYRIASLVPGEEQARMYAVLVVAAGGRPSISARPGP